MSIEQLRDMRRNGRKPATVSVIVGRPGKRFDDSPDQVVVSRDGMDLSPLVGLRVQILDLQPDADFALRVVAQLEQLQTVLVGACGAYGCIASGTEYGLALRRYQETLCPAK